MPKYFWVKKKKRIIELPFLYLSVDLGFYVFDWLKSIALKLTKQCIMEKDKSQHEENMIKWSKMVLTIILKAFRVVYHLSSFPHPLFSKNSEVMQAD